MATQSEQLSHSHTTLNIPFTHSQSPGCFDMDKYDLPNRQRNSLVGELSCDSHANDSFCWLTAKVLSSIKAGTYSENVQCALYDLIALQYP